ncbi:MAG: YoaP domain-containing protein [Dehalococcoidales bacterium]|nr:YoaP domain-containing protein [Dehalococcoidales bacterium]
MGKDCIEAQNSPCPFGIFCVLFNGKVVAHHPVSGTRFANIIKKELAV